MSAGCGIMIEVIPANLARGIQLVGVQEISGRRAPTSVLVAFRSPEYNPSILVRGVWLDSERTDDLPAAAVRDLVLEALPLPGGWTKDTGFECCPVCGGGTEGMAMTGDGRPICMTHLPVLLEQTARGCSSRSSCIACPSCGRSVTLLWAEGGRILCSHCLASILSGEGSPTQWVVTGFPPLPPEMRGDLRIFREAWRWITVCLRCGCSDVRVRRIQLDFAKAMGPVYPLWEIGQKERTPGAELRRWRQLQIYTQGFMRVTLECPHCGYLERELPGVGFR